MRERPSIPLITGLLDMGARVRAYDPAGMEQARSELPSLEFCADAYSYAKGADALVIVTEWVQFRALDLGRLRGNDGAAHRRRPSKRLPARVAAGFVYEGVGQSSTAKLEFPYIFRS
jgi:UDPglucose 6-dehydrogenase